MAGSNTVRRLHMLTISFMMVFMYFIQFHSYSSVHFGRYSLGTSGHEFEVHGTHTADKNVTTNRTNGQNADRHQTNKTDIYVDTDAARICRYETNMTSIYFNKSDDITDKDRSSKTRSQMCHGCFPRGFQTINEPIELCRLWPGQEQESIDVLFLILVSPGDEPGRANIRQSWVSVTQANRAARFRHLFVIGSAKNLQTQRRIDAEQAHYGDILQKDMPEGYRNITVKMVSGMEWATVHCSNAHYIMKVDIDTFVNVVGLISVISSIGPEVGLFGKCKYVHGPTRMKGHQLDISYEMHPEPACAPYCFGGGYVLTMEAAKGLVRIAPDMPPLGVEDVFVGMCLRELRLQGNNQHRIHDVPGYMLSPFEDMCKQPCHRMHKAAVWHKTRSQTMSCIWKKCYWKVCDTAWIDNHPANAGLRQRSQLIGT